MLIGLCFYMLNAIIATSAPNALLYFNNAHIHIFSLKFFVSHFIMIPFSSLKKEMQNIAIRASPLRSHSSVTGSKQKVTEIETLSQ